jgi:small-conductance mechanosensitive channel
MSEKQMFALLNQLRLDWQHQEFYWQITAVVLILAFSWWLSFRLRQHERGSERAGQSALRAFGGGSLKRIAFPLIALAFVLALRKAIKIAHLGHDSLLDLAVPLLVSWALIRILVYVLRCVFSNGGFLTSFERLITSAIWGGVVLNITDLDEYVIGIFEQVSFKIGRQTVNLWMLMHGAVTVCLTLLLALWIASLIENRLMAAAQMDANLREVLARLTKAILFVIALLCSLSMVGIDVTALSVFSGALAVGLGFGLQKIASNYVSGFIILLDRSIRLGNLVSVDDKTSGTVTQITTRYTVMRTLTGTEVIIPNEYLVSNIVRNLSFTDTRVYVSVSIQVAYSTEMEKAMQLMVEAARQQTRVLSDPAPKVFITEFAQSGILLELGFWLSDPEVGTSGVRTSISLAILKTFRENKIEIPFPQNEVRIIGGAEA